MAWPHLSSSSWSGVGGWWGCFFDLAEVISDAQRRMAVLALGRSIGASSWSQSAAALFRGAATMFKLTMFKRMCACALRRRLSCGPLPMDAFIFAA